MNVPGDLIPMPVSGYSFEDKKYTCISSLPVLHVLKSIGPLPAHLVSSRKKVGSLYGWGQEGLVPWMCSRFPV